MSHTSDNEMPNATVFARKGRCGTGRRADKESSCRDGKS